MKVIYKKTILEKIDMAIYEANCRNKEIDRIELTPEEGIQFVAETNYRCPVWINHPDLPSCTHSAMYNGVVIAW